ncbi:Tripartite tricarboxylate transporter TctB family protein [Calidithermus terrae]|uniref:Tripartite tricarboxylate transporter TctB family protein n=1 Tax=Calidithermus terrae TaxID=1408545 RepID=A0A399EBR0_9DEIN|nr:tripartite tricarboxylate transporter TctB family protein [Calidithermus terrae]RIH81785.1 Tripartite tricarboxylate transporter TctB family protein [Calidithermus terrae]
MPNPARRADRIVGVLLLLLALGYGWTASRFEVGLLSDPVGPKPFPYLIAFCTAAASLWLILRPDPDPQWPPAAFWLPLGLALGSLVAYAYLLVPLGFTLVTTLEMALLAVLFGARWWQGLLAGLAFSLAVYFLFTAGLNVPLPAGRLFG